MYIQIDVYYSKSEALSLTEIKWDEGIDNQLQAEVITYIIMWFLRAPRRYIGPTALPRAAVTAIAPERSECAIDCDRRPSIAGGTVYEVGARTKSRY